MSVSGLLTSVGWKWHGSETTAELLLDATVLPVLSTDEFTVGDFVMVEELGPYEVTEVDHEALTLTIDPPLEADTDGDATPVVPMQGDEPARYWSAEVVIEGSEEPIEVELVYNDLTALPEGEYDPPRPVTVSDDLTRIEDLPGQTPTIPGSFVTPDGLRLPEPTEPPENSPAILRVVPYSDSFQVVTDTIDQTSMLDYYVDGVPVLLNRRSTNETISTDSAGDPLQQDVDYTFSVLAHNSVGPAASGPSDPVVARLRTYGVGDISDLVETLAQLGSGGHLIDPKPVLTANSPSDGRISWPEFTVRYKDHTVTVPAGDTQERWTVYRWDEVAGTGSVEFTADKPTLADGDMILFINNAGVPIRPFATVLVDGDLLVDGSVVTSALASEAVTAEKIAGKTITGDLLSGDLVTGTTISTGLQTEDGLRAGARVEMGPAGLTIFDSAEQVIFQFPLNALDRAKVRAHMDMISADVEGNFRLHGTNNSIVTGGELVLDQGITAPVTPPDVEAVWDQVQFDTTTAVPPHSPSTNFNLGTFALNPSQITSIDWDPIWSVWLVGQQRSNGFRIWRFNANGTLAINTISGKPWADDFNNWSDASVVFDGDAASLFGKFGGAWYIMGRTQSGARLINTIPSAWITDSQGRPPIPSYDSGANQYFIAQSDGGGAGRLTIRRFWLNSGSDYPNAQTGTLLQMEAGSGLASRLHGCIYTSGAGLGGARYVVSADAYQSVWPHSTAGAVMDNDGSYEVWLKSGLARAFGFNGSQFVSVDATGKLTLYENWTWTTSNSDAYVGISAFDSDTAGVSTGTAAPHTGQTAGQHETPISEPLKFQQLRRAKLKFTVQETNDSGGADDPDKWKIYMIRKTTAPVAADFKHVVTLGSPSAISTHTISANPSGAAPPGGIVGTVGALNNFPGGGFGSVESAASDADGPIIKAQGNGPGRMGPWSWDADGKVTKHPIFGYEGITPTPTALNQTQNLTVNFPTGMFDVPPAVTVTHNAVNPYTCDVSVTSITTSSCIVRGSRRAGGLAGVPFTLIAVPMG